MHCVCDCDLVSEVDDDGLDLLRDEAVLKLVSKMVTILRVWQSRERGVELAKRSGKES